MAQEIVKPKVKAADQSVASSTVLVDAVDLSLPLGANETWEFEFRIPFNLAGAVSGAKFSVAGPAAPANVRFVVHVYNGLGLFAVFQLTAFGGSLAAAILEAGDFYVEVKGVVQNGPNAGNLKLQFAQNVSDVNPITVRRDAVLKATPVA